MTTHNQKMIKVCFVLTAEFAVKAFLINHLIALSKIYEVTIVVNTNNPDFLANLGVPVKVISLKIAREINIIADLICLMRLISIFRKSRFSAVHSVTPKAGLLAMSAAWLVRVPLRIHTFQGEVWVTKSGFMRYLLIFMDKMVNYFATNLIVVSQSERAFLIDQNIISAENSVVFNHGSISGVNFNKFKPSQSARKQIRLKYKITDDEVLFLYVGRLTTDKGILDLVDAFAKIKHTGCHLMFVGPEEKITHKDISARLYGVHSRVHFVEFTEVTERFMAAADVLCLPSYREGFGVVVIEAAAVGIPAIASRIYGITDAVIDGETGLLHGVKDSEAIKNCLQMMLNNHTLRLKLGAQAQTRAINHFDSGLITQAWVDFYRKNLNESHA